MSPSQRCWLVVTVLVILDVASPVPRRGNAWPQLAESQDAGLHNLDASDQEGNLDALSVDPANGDLVNTNDPRAHDAASPVKYYTRGEGKMMLALTGQMKGLHEQSTAKGEVAGLQDRLADDQAQIKTLEDQMEKVEDTFEDYAKANADSSESTIVQLGSKRTAISATLYGASFEEINFSGDGGLYAEMIRNRDFEQLGRGSKHGKRGAAVGEKYVAPKPQHGHYEPWEMIGGKCTNVRFRTDNTTAPFETNPVSLHISVPGGTSCSRVGLRNPGYWGITVVSGTSYRLSFFTRSSRRVFLAAALQTNESDIKCTSPLTIEVLPGEWKKHTAVLHGRVSTDKAVFVLDFDPAQGSTDAVDVWFDSISLIPTDAVKGIFRADIFQRLVDLKPAFLRFPGGSSLEGHDWETHWNWKRSIGPTESRPGHYNSAWGYWTTDGLGLYEFLVLCEELHAIPVISIFTGSHMGHNEPLNRTWQLSQDALDAIQFATGDEGYGALRMEMGHPEPFDLDHVEVGNEELNMVHYHAVYKLIAGRLKDAYPDLVIVASGNWGQSMEGHPCLSGETCAMWDDHFYRDANTMAKMGNEYDKYNRELPGVCVGEYAARPLPVSEFEHVTKATEPFTLKAALAEAIFMMGFERNADLVRMSSFSPLLANSKGTQWAHSLLQFNTSSVIPSPSYYVQQIFSDVRGEFNIETSVSNSWEPGHIASAQEAANGEPEPVVAASASVTGNLFTLKLVNYNPNDIAAHVNLGNNVAVEPHGLTMHVLTADEVLARNTFANVDRVKPKRLIPPSQFSTDGNVSVILEPWSLSVLQVQIRPTPAPTSVPTPHPTAHPTPAPTDSPTLPPTASPTLAPTAIPTDRPTPTPTEYPTKTPTSPTPLPSADPTATPTPFPTANPTPTPTEKATPMPTPIPTGTRIMASTGAPSPDDDTPHPTSAPTRVGAPTKSPSFAPTPPPTKIPTAGPSPPPTFAPTIAPTWAPEGSYEKAQAKAKAKAEKHLKQEETKSTLAPTHVPTGRPITPSPTQTTTKTPTAPGAGATSLVPTVVPTQRPTTMPSATPTVAYTERPTPNPTMPTSTPTSAPSPGPTHATPTPTKEVHEVQRDM